MLAVTSVLLVCICKYVMCLPCLTDGSKKSFNDTRKDLTALETYIGRTLNSLDSNLKTLKSNVGSKIKNLNGKLNVLEDDFSKQQWVKYDGHCYYHSNEPCDWFTAERFCRDFGGYLVKIDNSSENEWLHSKRQMKSSGYWIGLTDLIEGEWRWSIDHSLATYKAWYRGKGSLGHNYNCVSFVGSNAKWFDTNCKSAFFYICEINDCN